MLQGVFPVCNFRSALCRYHRVRRGDVLHLNSQNVETPGRAPTTLAETPQDPADAASANLFRTCTSVVTQLSLSGTSGMLRVCGPRRIPMRRKP